MIPQNPCMYNGFEPHGELIAVIIFIRQDSKRKVRSITATICAIMNVLEYLLRVISVLQPDYTLQHSSYHNSPYREREKKRCTFIPVLHTPPTSAPPPSLPVPAPSLPPPPLSAAAPFTPLPFLILFLRLYCGASHEVVVSTGQPLSVLVLPAPKALLQEHRRDRIEASKA